MKNIYLEICGLRAHTDLLTAVLSDYEHMYIFIVNTLKYVFVFDNYTALCS